MVFWTSSDQFFIPHNTSQCNRMRSPGSYPSVPESLKGALQKRCDDLLRGQCKDLGLTLRDGPNPYQLSILIFDRFIRADSQVPILSPGPITSTNLMMKAHVLTCAFVIRHDGWYLSNQGFGHMSLREHASEYVRRAYYTAELLPSRRYSLKHNMMIFLPS